MSIDWFSSMQQTYEYYKVNPNTWTDDELIDTVNSSSIKRDSTAETLGSASFDIDGELNECYIRIYLIANQNGVTEKHPLGTYLVQSPTMQFDGKIKKYSLDAYTPLVELKENKMALGYALLKGDKIMDSAYRIIRDGMRAPIIKTENSETLTDDYVADTNETKLSFCAKLVENAKYQIGLDDMCRAIFTPIVDVSKMSPVISFNDDNSSILLPTISISSDVFNVPNVVEVIYSNGKTHYEKRVVNDDPNSMTSTIVRGREIIYRDENPNLYGKSSEAQIEEYARLLLKRLSSVSFTVSFSHAYIPYVRLGDCVELNYTRAGIKRVKAKIISQSINCVPGCTVDSTAVFNDNLWGG